MLGLEKDRLDTLIDGVFAIALTLLVLELKVPEGLTLTQLPNHLAELWPKFAAYTLAFFYLATIWLSHFFFSKLVIRVDFTAMALSLLQMVFIGVLPFSAALLGSYPRSPWALVAFGGSILGFLLSVQLYWLYSTRNHRLTSPTLDEKLVRDMTLLIWLYIFGWVSVIAMSFVSYPIAVVLTVAILFAALLFLWLLQPRILRASVVSAVEV